MSTAAWLWLMRDFKSLQLDPPAGISGAPQDNNIMLWNAVIAGPDRTPLEGGTFRLTLNFTKDYPNQPPTVRFVSPMFHPNIYADGSICLNILQNGWSPIGVAEILTSIQSLLCDPNPNSPANSEAAQMFREDRPEYNRRVREIVEQSWTADQPPAPCAIDDADSRNARLARDLRRLERDPPAGISVAPQENDTMLCNALIVGPDRTPLEGGTFKLTLKFTNDYPYQLPTVRFVSPMFHPNIYADGRICLTILQNPLRPEQDVATLLTSIRSFLSDEPNTNCPANPEAARMFRENKREYNRRVREIVKQSWKADQPAAPSAIGGTT